MIDIHTHILPGIDDGSRDVKESAEILEACRNQGVTDICLTPHFYPDRMRLEHFLVRRAKAYDLLKNNCDLTEFRILIGSETAWCRGISHSNQLEKLCIEGTDLLLLELPFGVKWPEGLLSEVASIRREQGLRVIIAHAERYVKENGGYALFDRLKETGAYIQISTDFLIGRFTRHKAIKLIREGKADFLGSDTHRADKRRENMAEADQVMRSRLGDAFTDAFIERERKLLGLK